MKTTIFISFILSLLLNQISCCYDYSHHGKNWECSLCQHGSKQSPINIETQYFNMFKEPKCAGMSFQFYDQVEIETVNTGNTFQSDVNFSTLSLIDINERHSHYNVSQFHFHAPSEHTIDNKRYDLEIHIVFKRIDGDSQGLTVIGIMFEITDNPDNEAEFFMEYAFPNSREGSHVHQMALDFKHIFSHILDEGTVSYRYEGSLTTGSCSENVNWYVIQEPLKILRSNYQRFHLQWSNNKQMPEGNNREIQQKNGRRVEIVRFCQELIKF